MNRINVFEFNRPQRKAITKCGFIAEFLDNMPDVGQRTLNKLVARGVLEVSDQHRPGAPTYKLTAYGNEVHDALQVAKRLF
ncbi:hypothetical protein ABIB57_004254 [Devosia sp. UYZn731]|uniref:hypothetical protein n=1 Tax=Devosia sp. UYZn731 TaxID=3156345 RepID=UPI0033969D24